MRREFAVIGGNAKNRGGNLCPRKERGVHLSVALAECARAVFVKPAQTLADLFKISERDAKYRLAAQRKFTADEIAELLRTEQGIRFLVTIMGDARPRWWTAILRMGVMGGVVRRREADAQLLRRFANADEDATTQISARLRVSDEDFFEPVLEAMAAVTRAPTGPVAPAKGSRR